ncbi:MAG: hydroxyacid dehydrogenase [Planctomycetota bacterium]|nr:hydroxyacid dehydrogenase [Planctomycetota bacterium]
MAVIIVSEDIQGAPIEALANHYEMCQGSNLWNSADQLRTELQPARALIVRNQTCVTSDLLSVAPQLEIIARAGVGLDNIDVEAASKLGIVVTSTPNANSIAVAELTLGLMFALARHLIPAHAATAQGAWQRQEFTGVELAGQTLGIVGFGKIGRLLAVRARACGMHIAVHDPILTQTAPEIQTVQAEWLPFESLLAAADVISCHVPLTVDTHHLFDYEQFAAMRPTVFFINTSRGGVVSESGLARALQEGRLAGAALDVRENEPPTKGSLEGHDNVILTPHIGAFTEAAQQRVVESVARDVQRVLTGQPATEYVNFDRPRR